MLSFSPFWPAKFCGQDVTEMERKFRENTQQPLFLLPSLKVTAKALRLKKKNHQTHTKSMGLVQT